MRISLPYPDRLGGLNGLDKLWGDGGVVGGTVGGKIVDVAC